MKHTNTIQQTPRLSVTVAEAARSTGFSENYIRLLIARLLLPHVRVGRAVRLMVDDLEQFLDQHRQAAPLGRP